MNDFKDQAAETFGLIIAYLLPGVVGLFSLSLWSTSVDTALKTFLTSASNINLFLLVVIASLAIGLMLAAIRGLIFERWHIFNLGYKSKVTPLTSEEFKALASPEKFAPFRAIVDAHYRYHQCWGGILVVLPVFYFGWVQNLAEGAVLTVDFVLRTLGVVGLAVVTFLAAQGAYRKYVERARAILGGEQQPVATPPQTTTSENVLIKDDFLYIRTDKQLIHQTKADQHWYDYPNRTKHVKRILIKKGNAIIADQMFSPSECEITIWLG